LEQNFEALLDVFVTIQEIKGRETPGHIYRMHAMAHDLAERLGLDEQQKMNLRVGVWLHDLGMLALPDAVLFKPGALTEEEWLLIKQHPHYGNQFIREVPNLAEAARIVLCHHEQWNGNGYPDHLAGEEIPFLARIAAIVDVYNALLSDMPYRPAWTPEAARKFMAEEAGKMFDPELIKEFLLMIEPPR
jgi:HD-GYP domain-containing protein (c-di-GMP phosphodiesterase class II)